MIWALSTHETSNVSVTDWREDAGWALFHAYLRACVGAAITADIMNDPVEVAALRRAEAEVLAGRVHIHKRRGS